MPHRTVLVFGTFDEVHHGHRFFLSQARALGDRLVVVVARDETVPLLKRKQTKQPEMERLATMANLSLVDEAALGDRTLGVYRVVERFHPDLIVLGYDQTALRRDLERWMKEQGKPIPLLSLKKVKRTLPV